MSTVIQGIPNHLTGSYEATAWEAFRRIREAGDTVQFIDILVSIDTLRGTNTEESRNLRFVANLLRESERLATARARTEPVVVSESHVAVEVEPSSSELIEVDLGPPSREDRKSPSLSKKKRVELKVVTPSRGMALLDALRAESRIRIYVETGSNKGHQSASVTLARKLVQWLLKDKKKLNPKLVIEFLCNDEDAKSKAVSIIGGDARSLDGIKVEVTTFGYGLIKPSPVNYAFSGAIDNPLVTFPRLKAKCLVGLQPIGWAGGPEMVVTNVSKQPTYLILTKGSGQRAEKATDTIPFPAPFMRLPFTEPANSESPSWEPSAMPDRIVAAIMERARATEAESVKPADKVFVCPLYGMGSGQPMEGYRNTFWRNAVLALLALLARSEFPGRIILLNVSKDMGNSPVGTWGALAREFGENASVLIEQQGVTLNRVDGIFEALRGPVRLVICTVEKDKDMRTMDLVYRESRLPPIFEGQGSLTQVIPMGRPFVKLSMRAAVDKDWPSDYLPVPGMEGIDVRIQTLSNSIIEDWKNLRNKDCAAELATLLLEMSEPSSKVYEYFRACRVVATNPCFDRLVWAAEALARLISPPKEKEKPEPKKEVVVLPEGSTSGSKSKTDEALGRRIKAEHLFLQSLVSSFDKVENPGGGDCLYYAFDDGLNERDMKTASKVPDRLGRATTLRTNAVVRTAALIRGGQGLTEDMFRGMEIDNLDALLELIPPAMERTQELYDTFFQIARIEIGMGSDEVFSDNDPRLVTISRLVAHMMEGAIAQDVELQGWLNTLADGYTQGQGRQSEWAGELEYFGLVLENQVNLRVHYVDASPNAVRTNNCRRVTEYRYHVLAAQFLGTQVQPVARTIDIFHINGGTHYVYGRPKH